MKYQFKSLQNLYYFKVLGKIYIILITNLNEITFYLVWVTSEESACRERSLPASPTVS